jgi:hypothetical protein
MTSTLGLGAPVKAPPRRPGAGRPVAPRRRRLRVVVLALALVVVVALVAVNWWPSSTPLSSSSFTVPSAYSVTYAVTTAGGAPATERLWVRRPFDSVDITYAGSQPSGTPSLVTVYRLGVQVLKAVSAQAGLLRIPAGPAPQDVRADVFLPAALHAHKLKVVGHGRVLGRPCLVFRSTATLRAGPLPTLRPGSTYVDTCIDSAGIVLRESQIRSGRTLLDRLAVQVQTGDAAVATAPFDMTGTPTPYDSGGGAFTPLTLTSRPPGGSWEIARLPHGFTHLGRFAVVPPQPQLFGQGGNGYGSMGLPGGLVTEMDDVYVRGADVIVLQQGSTLNGATFTPPANSDSIDLDRLGHGQLLIAGNGSTIVAEPGNGKGFVRLAGTLPTDDLIAMMRALARQPGGTLTRLPGASDNGAAG